MKDLILTALLISKLTITSYRSTPSQTDNSPYYTSIGDHVCKHGIAISQDLLASGQLKYGDWVYIEDIGIKQINDTMAAKMTQHVDVWVGTLAEERAFHKKYKGRKLKIWKIKIGEN